MRLARLYQRKWLVIQLPLIAGAALLASFLWIHVFPMPPTVLSMTTAESHGAYYRNALLYSQVFARHGVTLLVLPSAGSQQNLERLRRGADASDLAFLQGGFGYLGDSLQGDERSRIETLANVDIEPLWLFSRRREIESLGQLQGLRVAVGPPGSGSRKVALRLMEQARVQPADSPLAGLLGNEAVQALGQGSIDAAVMVASLDSAVVQSMLRLPGIHLANLRRSTAIIERNPYLEQRLLPQGSLPGRLPPHDITVLTTSASLVAREGLDPALKRLAMAAAAEVHAGPGLFHNAGDFPALRQIDFPTAPGARQTLLRGLPWLERTLPFWWAQVAERVLLIVLPVTLLALWLMHVFSAWLRWSLESRVNRWYGELKFIENDLGKTTVTGMDITRFLQRLNGMDKAMVAFPTPRELMARCYTLHQHIEFVRQRLYRMRGR